MMKLLSLSLSLSLPSLSPSPTKESDAYQKTTTSLKSATQKTGVVLTLAGTSVKSKLGDLKKSPSIQSLQERVNSTYNRIAG